MGDYLDRLNKQFDEIVNGMEAITNRAAEDNRDVNDDESKQIDRDKGRLDELTKAIEHYSALETQASKVAELRRSVPASPASTRTATAEVVEAYDIAREFPSVADYAITVHRAMTMRDPASIEKLDRATAHQTLADNPGLVPRPILGPVLNLIGDARPFINSITRRPLPAPKFDRPYVSQHVAVDIQAAEKTLTASQQMKVLSLAVTASTFAGHLNISRQDIKWTSPGILQIVFDDFAVQYALRTCDFASDAFATSVTNTEASDGTSSGLIGALFGAMSAAMTANTATPDTVWMSPDVWAAIGGMTRGSDQNPAFPGLTLTGTSGTPLGLRQVVEPHFPADTFIVGPSRLAEWYEDIDGLMQVQEPDVLGQLVGYAGYGAFVNVAPETFTKVTGVKPVPDGGGA